MQYRRGKSEHQSIKLEKNSCETQPGIRLTEKAVRDSATFIGQSQNLETVPQRQYYPLKFLLCKNLGGKR